MPVNNEDKPSDKNVGRPSALQEARRQYAAAESRVRKLRRSIQIIEKKIEAGEVWPGEEAQVH